MAKIDIVRAWKDEIYRNSLSKAELAQLPENPASMIELTDADLDQATGGTTTAYTGTSGCCTLGGICPTVRGAPGCPPADGDPGGDPIPVDG